MSCITDYYNIEYLVLTMPLFTAVGSAVVLVKQADEGLRQSTQLYMSTWQWTSSGCVYVYEQPSRINCNIWLDASQIS